LDLGPAKSAYDDFQGLFESRIEEFLREEPLKGVLLEIARYSLLDSGKRIRPVLCLAVAESLNIELKRVLPFCLAVELLHNSSLIHDDLPSLDDDSLRRGRETVHILYGEAQAILAGDAFISLAFEVVSRPSDIPAQAQVCWTRLLSRAFTDLCAGQSLDIIEMKGERQENDIEAAELRLRNRHSLKTGALIRASALGAVQLLTADTSIDLSRSLGVFAEHLGLLFQITDDLQDASELGDSEHDSDSSEATYVSLLGLEGAVRRAQEVANHALDALDSISYDTEFLQQLTLAVRDRA
jgi:geranylgeranyl pyrophosphate synthase